MARFIPAILALIVLVASAPAFAQTYQAPPAAPAQQQQSAQPAPAPGGQYPSVQGLEPFSAPANFMSLPGYLRWVVFQQTGQWLSRPEAARIVGQQTGTANQ